MPRKLTPQQVRERLLPVWDRIREAELARQKATRELINIQGQCPHSDTRDVQGLHGPVRMCVDCREQWNNGPFQCEVKCVDKIVDETAG